MRPRSALAPLFLALVTCVAAARPARAGYDKPPQNVLDVLRAPSPPVPYVSPTDDRILLVSWVRYPPIAQVAEPFLRLAGVRVEPRTRRKHDTPGGYGIAPCAQSLTLVDVATSRETPVTLPPDGCVDGVTWAADGQAVRVPQHLEGRRRAVDLRRRDRRDPAPRRRAPEPDARELAAVDARPEDAARQARAGERPGRRPRRRSRRTARASRRRPARRARAAPTRRATRSRASTTRTSSTTTRPASSPSSTRTRVRSRRWASRRSSPGSTPAPDGEHLLVTTIHKPYSYVTTYRNFAHDVELWDRTGTQDPHARAGSRSRIAFPIAGVPTGPRAFEWRPTEPATLVWAEALDGGDWNVSVPARDKVMTLKAPFTATPAEIARTEQRFAGFDWSERRGVALLHEYDENRHWRRTFLADVDHPTTKPVRPVGHVERRALQGPRPPGLQRRCPNGQWVVRAGRRRDLPPRAGARRRTGIGRSSIASTSKTHASVAALPERQDRARVLPRVHRPDRARVPDVAPVADGSAERDAPHAGKPIRVGEAAARPRSRRPSRAVTHIPDPTPAVRAIKKRLVKYKRKDGTPISRSRSHAARLQGGHAHPGDPLRVPARLRERVDRRADHRLRAGVHAPRQLPPAAPLRATRSSTTPRFPIVGDPKKAYDTYLEQLVDDARAAVDKAVEHRRRRSRPHRRHRPQPRGAHDGEPDRPHGPLPRRRRDERLVQQDAHAVRLPERAPLRLEGRRACTFRSRRSSSPTGSSCRS